MRLLQYINEHKRPPVIPLMGYPGATLTGTTIKQNAFNHEIHFQSLQALYDTFSPNGLFFFMDLSVEAGALGLQVQYPLMESPIVENHPVTSREDLEKLAGIDIMADCRVESNLATMKLMKKKLSCLKGAYVTGPFTLASLLCGASEAAMLTIDNPDLLHAVCRFCADTVSRYAKALEDAGADMIMVLEPSAVMLSPRQFTEFSGNYVGSLDGTFSVDAILHICGDTTHLLPGMAATGVAGFSLDYAVDLAASVEAFDDGQFLMGNLDPVGVLRDDSPENIHSMAVDLAASMQGRGKFILSSGCDIPHDAPAANIQAFMEAARLG